MGNDMPAACPRDPVFDALVFLSSRFRGQAAERRRSALIEQKMIFTVHCQ